MGRVFAEIEFDQRGLAPCVVQDFATGEVLMLAYVSAQSLEMTLETGDLHFHSRSRDELWRKGETSGAFMHLRQLRYEDFFVKRELPPTAKPYREEFHELVTPAE